MKMMTRKTKSLMCIPPVVCILLLGIRLFGEGNFSSRQNILEGKRIYLPSCLPASSVSASSFQEDDILVSFSSYVAWCFDVASLPYRNLRETLLPCKKGDVIYFCDYIQDEMQDGKQIQEQHNKVLSFDSDFVSFVKDKVSKQEYPSLEKMLMLQDENLFFAYSQGRQNMNQGAKDIVMLVFLSILPVVFYLYCLYFRHGRKKLWW